MNMVSKIIDVSKWNADVDYKSVKEAGITGVIIQCGYGKVSSQKDAYFEKNYKKAKAHGLKVGAYLYSYAESVADAKEEAKVCLGWIKGKKFDLPIYIDMEEKALTRLGKTTLTKIASTFCNIIKEAGYKKVGVYANADWFRNYLNYNELKKNYSIWLAQYANNKDFSCDIWQYTDKLMINGKTFDGNFCYKEFVTSKEAPKVKVCKNYPLRARAYIDPVTNSNPSILVIPKNAEVQWLLDDRTGWSRIKYRGKTGYVINNRLKGKKNLSKYSTKVFNKGTKYYRIVKGKIKYTKCLDKPRKFTIISFTEAGKYKGWYYVLRNGKYYFIK